MMHLIHLETLFTIFTKRPMQFGHLRDAPNALGRMLHVLYRYAMLLHWPAAMYEDAHNTVLQHMEDPDCDETRWHKSWSVFVSTCLGRWKTYIGFCTAYNA